MTEYERGFIDGIKSKVSAELTPTLINVSKTMLEMLKPVLSTALENALNDNNAITDTDVQPVKHGRWSECYTDSRLYSGICSVCGGAAIRSVKANPLDYCPDCGARMDLKDGERE